MAFPFPLEHFIYFQYGIPAAAILVVALYLVMGRRPWHFLRGLLLAALCFLCVLSLCYYTNPQWRRGEYFNAYEFFHYYLGAKYADEVGYSNLYNAVVVADTESGFTHKNRTIRDLETSRIVPIDRVLQKKAHYKALFSEERWKDFVADVPFFRSRVSPSLWGRMLNDKGYNATPVWTMVSGSLANAVSTRNYWGMIGLATLDACLALAALACVWWAFGHRTMLLLIIFLGTHYLLAHATLKAAFLRLDWVMCLVMAACMLKKERYAAAGALSAYAALARVFPAVFAFGIGAKLLVDLLRTRRINRRYLAYFAAYGVTIAVLVTASVIYAGGLESWKEFTAKVGSHNKDISAWRVGFKYVFLMSYNGSAFWRTSLSQFFADRQVIWWGIQAAVLLVSLFLVRNLEDYEALAYSYVPTYFLVAPTYYYHVMLALPFLFFAPKLERPTRAAGLIMMFATIVVAYKMYLWWNRGFPLFFSISCMIGAMVLYIMFLSGIEAFRKPPQA